MTSIRRTTLLAVLCGIASSAPALAADIGVSVSVNQPGFYGRIDINQPPPPVALVYPQPVVIQQQPVAVVQQPIYLRVPPGHEKHWAKHCAQYNACGQPVYFVRDTYYQQHYVVQQPPRVVQGQQVMVVRERDDDDHGHGHGNGNGHGNGHGRGHGKHDD